MTDLFDRAQQQEQEFRERAIAKARLHPQEQPDQDEHGNRFCLMCGEQIAAERALMRELDLAMPDAAPQPAAPQEADA